MADQPSTSTDESTTTAQPAPAGLKVKPKCAGYLPEPVKKIHTEVSDTMELHDIDELVEKKKVHHIDDIYKPLEGIMCVSIVFEYLM